MTNLLLNACDAVEGRENRLLVFAFETQPETVTLCLTDSGAGIDSDHRDRILEPFFTTKGVGQGSGLGLSVSRQLAEAQGGQLELGDSEQGAQFRLVLPRI